MGIRHRQSYSCDSEADLAQIQAQAQAGESAYCISEDSAWRKVGGVWEAASLTGPQGDKGDKGDKGDTGATGTQCYTLPITAANLATATDAQTIYFGSLAGLAPGTTAALARVYIPKSGSIKAAYIFAHAATSGTNEAWVLHVRLNNTSDTQISSLSANTATRLWSNAALSIPVVAGDYIEIKSVNPTWATNPANVRFGGVVYVEV